MAETTWTQTIPAEAALPTLTKDIRCDVAIVGAGLAGTLTAYYLQKEGKTVVLIDKGQPLREGATARTTAFVTHVIDTDLAELVDLYGDRGAKLIWYAHKDAVDAIETIVRTEQIDCEFMRVNQYELAFSEDEFDSLLEEEAIANEYGFPFTASRIGVTAFENDGALTEPNQAKFHPLKFLRGLRDILRERGVQIFENTEALAFVEPEHIHGVVVQAARGSVHADDVVIATYRPFNQPRELFAHTGMYVSYVLELALPKGRVPEGLYIDQHNPYHYFRVDAGQQEDRMILGGEDHRKEIPLRAERNFRPLREFFTHVFPDVPLSITRQWSGPILETIDGVAYIGRRSDAHPHEYIIEGFSGNGMTYSNVAAQICSDTICGKHNMYAEVFAASRRISPKRVARKGVDFAGEFFGGAAKNLFA